MPLPPNRAPPLDAHRFLRWGSKAESTAMMNRGNKMDQTEIKEKGEQVHDVSAGRSVSSPLSTASLKPFALCALQPGDLAESSKSAPCLHPPWRHQERSFRASCRPRSPLEPTVTRSGQNQQHRDMRIDSSVSTRSPACNQPQPLALSSDTTHRPSCYTALPFQAVARYVLLPRAKLPQ
jgi:hypothetical protein